MKFDDIIEELGEFGPYQKRIYYLVCLIGFPSAMQTMGILFTMGSRNHRCELPVVLNDTYKTQDAWHDNMIQQWVPWDDDEDAYSSCKLYKQDNRSISNATESCSHYVYDNSIFDSSFISDIDIVCDDKSLSTYANMIYMGGLLGGSLVMGSLADIIGRKKVLLIGIVGHLGVSIGLAFVQSYTAFVIVRFFTAFFGIGNFLAAFVIGMEVVGPGKRKFAGIVIEMFWVVSLFVLALIGYFVRYWRTLQIIISTPTVFLLSFSFLLPESPRWLISKDRLDEARKILKTIAKNNKVTLSEKALDLENLECEGAGEKIWAMFTHKILVVRSLIVFYNWLVASLVYYGLSLNVGALSGDIHLNFFLSSLVEGAAYVFCIVFLDRTGRKGLQCLSMMVAGIACLGTMFPVMYGGGEWVTLVLSLVGKFGASAAFAIIYIYSAELFPTTMRNSGMGLSSFSARIGGIAAPYIADMANVIDGDMGVALPLIIFGGVSVFAGLLVLFLPETTNQILPDTVQDAKEFGKKSSKNTYALKDVAANGKDNPGYKI